MARQKHPVWQLDQDHHVGVDDACCDYGFYGSTTDDASGCILTVAMHVMVVARSVRALVVQR